MIRYLSRADVEVVSVPIGKIADAIEVALRAAEAGALVNQPKSSIDSPEGVLFQSMLAAGLKDPAPPYAAAKVLGLSPANEAKGLPHIGALIVVLARDSGLPVAILDAAWITEARTAALSLIAARRMARRGAERIGFIACGGQARSHLAAFKAEFRLKTVTAWSRRATTAAAFAGFARGLGLEARLAARAEEAVRDQDIVITSVPAGPESALGLEFAWLAPGAFAALVDLGRCWRDRGYEGIERTATDAHAQAVQKPGARKLVPAGPHSADLADLVTGRAAGRQNESQRAVFVFQGLALADLAAAALVVAEAERRAIGVLLQR